MGNVFSRVASWAAIAVGLADPGGAVPHAVQAVLVAVSGVVIAVTHLAESIETAAQHKATAAAAVAVRPPSSSS